MEAFVWIVLTFGGGATQVEIGGQILFQVDTRPEFPIGGSWLPHIGYYMSEGIDHGGYRTPEQVARHEMEHQEHWESLGPAFPISYLLSAGRPFEGYLDGMWEPPEDLTRQCPAVRIADTVEFMPCWRF